MRITIVYDSVFGNTAKIAKHMGDAVAENNCVKVIHANELKNDYLINANLFIIGSPTRGFKPTKNITNILKKLNRRQNPNMQVAVFDTRMDIAKLDIGILKFLEKRMGYATDSMEKLLRRRGFLLQHQPIGLFVTDSEGPLGSGESERAAAWLIDIVAKLAEKDMRS